MASTADPELFDPRAQVVLPDELERALAECSRVGLQAESLAVLYATLERAEALGRELVVVHSDLPAVRVASLAERHGLDAMVRESGGVVTVARAIASPDPIVANPPGRAGDGWLGLFTSGSSGFPKLAVHDWAAIARPAERVPERLRGMRWLLAYAPTTYAGLQIYYACRAAAGTLVRPPGAGPAEAARAIISGRVDVVSATPTYWRMLMHAWPAELARPQLRQATLGGEAVSQDTLDRVRDLFHPERITTVYASTEAGTSIVVSDGREGFPSAYLDDPDRETRLRVRDGQLEIATAGGMRGYLGERGIEAPAEWVRTPDRIEVRGDRAHFAGRVDTVVNVGGTKVAVDEVEAVLVRCAGVLDARVYPRESVVVGAFLVADVVPTPGAILSTAALKSEMMLHLPPHAVPQQFRVVDTLEMAASGKKRRA